MADARTKVVPDGQIEALGARISIPTKESFGTEPYKSASDLSILGAAVIGKFPDRFKAAQKFELRYLWKASGGSQFGKPHYGDCQRTDGLVKHFAGCDFVVWFAADHLRDTAFMQKQLEALMFRCLCHIGVNENTGSPQYLGPDFVGYRDELANYGFWDAPLAELAKVIRQPSLWDAMPPEESDAWSASPPNNVSRFPHTEADAETERTMRQRGGGRVLKPRMEDGTSEGEAAKPAPELASV